MFTHLLRQPSRCSDAAALMGHSLLPPELHEQNMSTSAKITMTLCLRRAPDKRRTAFSGAYILLHTNMLNTMTNKVGG